MGRVPVWGHAPVKCFGVWLLGWGMIVAQFNVIRKMI